MNLSIQDGRAELWQWDTGVRLVMDEACEAVNISASTFGVTVDVTAAEDGKTWVAAVPDEMLQKPGDLICYAVQSTATGTITAAYRSFRVNRRPKPAGYVATPTESRTWQELDDRKIDAPQVAQVGEVLTVEAVDADGKPKKWKTAPGVNITTELTHESTDSQVPSAKAAYDAIGQKIDKNQGTKNAGKILGIGADGNVTPQNKPAQALAGAAAPTTATAGVVGQEYYVIVNNAVTEMYVCTAVANGTYTWDKVEFGGGNTTGVSLGITGASVGQIAKITAVDSAGKPTGWEPVDMPNRLDVTVSMGDNGWVVSHKFAEIKAAYDAGRAVQLIDTDTFRKYSLMGFFPGRIEGVTYADFRYIDNDGTIWQARINSNDEIEFFQGSPFITLYGDIPQYTPKAITYSVENGIGYADFIPYIEIPSTGDELKERLVIGPAYFYVMPNAYAPFVLKNLVNPYTLTRLSYSEPEFGTENNTFEASYLVTDSFGQQIKATCQVLLTESGLGDLAWNFEVRDSLIVKSSTDGSSKKFKITVDDSGTLTATELV